MATSNYIEFINWKLIEIESFIKGETNELEYYNFGERFTDIFYEMKQHGQFTKEADKFLRSCLIRFFNILEKAIDSL